MPTYSETILERYSQTETEIDAFGRTIKVQRIRPDVMAQVKRLADSDKGTVLGPIIVAASVREIVDETGKSKLFAPPRTEVDISIILNALDSEGIDAAGVAYGRLVGVKADADTKALEGAIDTAKNSQATSV